jgi:hypothetical protein
LIYKLIENLSGFFLKFELFYLSPFLLQCNIYYPFHLLPETTAAIFITCIKSCLDDFSAIYLHNVGRRGRQSQRHQGLHIFIQTRFGAAAGLVAVTIICRMTRHLTDTATVAPKGAATITQAITTAIDIVLAAQAVASPSVNYHYIKEKAMHREGHKRKHRETKNQEDHDKARACKSTQPRTCWLATCVQIEACHELTEGNKWATECQPTLSVAGVVIATIANIVSPVSRGNFEGRYVFLH